MIISEGLGRIRITHNEGGRKKISVDGVNTGIDKPFRIELFFSVSSIAFIMYGDGSSEKITGISIVIDKYFEDARTKITDIYFSNPAHLTGFDLAKEQLAEPVFGPISNTGNAIKSVAFSDGLVNFKYLRNVGSRLNGFLELINIPNSLEDFFAGSDILGAIAGNIDILNDLPLLASIRLGNTNGNEYIYSSRLVFDQSKETINLNNWPNLKRFHCGIAQPGLQSLILNEGLEELVIGTSEIVNLSRLPNSILRFHVGGNCKLDFDTKTLHDYLPLIIPNGFSLVIENVQAGKSIGALNTGTLDLGSVFLNNCGATSLTLRTNVLAANNNPALTTINNDATDIYYLSLRNCTSLTTFNHGFVTGDGITVDISGCVNLNTVIKCSTRYQTSIAFNLSDSGMTKTTLIDQINFIFANKVEKSANAGVNTFILNGASNASLLQPVDGIYPSDDAHANSLFGFVRGGGITSNGTAGTGDGVTAPVDGSPGNVFEKMYVMVNQCQLNGFYRYGANFLFNS